MIKDGLLVKIIDLLSKFHIYIDPQGGFSANG